MLKRSTSMPRGVGTKMSMTGSRFPLPDECFSSPDLTQDGEETLIRMGMDALKLLVRETRVDRAGGPVQWTLDHDDEGLQIYVGSEIGKAKETVFMSVTEMPATLEEAAALHASDTNEAFHEFITKYNPDLCDCRVIKTLAPTTEKHPYNYIGIKWFCFESPPPVRNRDFVFVECRDVFQINGVKGWARVMESVDLPFCVPDLRSAMGIVRASIHASGIVFKEIPSRPGMVQVMQVYNLDLGGKVPSWIQRIAMKRRAKSLLHFDMYLHAKRLGLRPLLADADLVKTSSRRRCFLCQSRFSPFSKRQNCRLCGEVMCRHCHRQWELTDPNRITRYVRVCVRCANDSIAHGGGRAHTIVGGVNDRSDVDDARDVRAASLPTSQQPAPQSSGAVPFDLVATAEGPRRRRPPSPRRPPAGHPSLNGRLGVQDVVLGPREGLAMAPKPRVAPRPGPSSPRPTLVHQDFVDLTNASAASHQQLLDLFQQMKKLKLEERFGDIPVTTSTTAAAV